MAKREIVEVDEEYMKAIMACDIPRIKIARALAAEQETAQLQEEVVEEKVEVKITDSPKLPPSPVSKAVKSQKETQDFEDIFLARKLSTERSQCYISKYSYEKISHYLAVIGKETTITAYIDNILRHHMEQYKDKINELYEQKTKKPF